MTTITEQLASSVEASDKLRETVLGKAGEIDSKVDESIETQKQLTADSKAAHQQFMEESDNEYLLKRAVSVYVPGDADKFYPVYVPADHNGIADIEITRSIHTDRTWAGSMNAKFLAQNNGWGNRPNILILDVLSHTSQPSTPSDVASDGFIANFLNGTAYVGGVVFWLRGDHTYSISSTLKRFEGVVTHTELVTSSSFDHNINIFTLGYDITQSGYRAVASVLSDRSLTTVPSINYVRGL